VGLTPIQAALLELARDSGRPLETEDLDDAATVLRAETLVRQGWAGGQALEQARLEAPTSAVLRGIVRHARARHDDGRLELGDLYALGREALVAAANALYAIPADEPVEISEDDVLAAFPGARIALGGLVRPYDLGAEFGRAVATCVRCSGLIRSKQRIAVYYDRVTTPEWRVIVVDHNVAQRGALLVTSQALLDGAPALCWECTVRFEAGLLVWRDGALRHVIYENDVVAIDPDSGHADGRATTSQSRGSRPVASDSTDDTQIDLFALVDDRDVVAIDDTLSFDELMGGTGAPVIHIPPRREDDK